MNLLKPHFWYNKSQRNGVFLLVVLIIIFQAIIVFVDFSSDTTKETNTLEILAVQKQIDSLKAVELERRKPKIYPFNPNYITDYKGEQLGMSLEEIDRLLTFRKTNKFVNSKKEFQNITRVSDSLLHAISPYFKFPDWVVKRNQLVEKQKRKPVLIQNDKTLPKESLSTTDINKATIADLQTINGLNGKLANRIIKYRSKIQGFSYRIQLYEVWSLERELADKILATFKILEKPIIKKENVNNITFKELLKNPYVNYNLCVKIFNYRDQVAEMQNISELKNIQDFPLDKYDRIVLYLVAE